MSYTFQGYRRANGTFGARNLVAVIPSVICANDVGQAICRQVQGTIGYFHHQGCCQLPIDLKRVTDTLSNLGQSPNVGAALIVSLGCEGTDHERLVEEIRATGKPVEIIRIQELGGTSRAIQAGIDAAQRLVQQISGVPISQKADIVIASCGGYPKDINLYQGIKTLLNMGQAVKPGGTMIFVAQCPDGGGAPDFFDWSRSLKTNSLDADLRAGFTIAGYIFYAGCEVIRGGRVLMLTELSPETLRDMGIEGYTDMQQLLASVDFTGKDVIVMPHGGSTVPYVSQKVRNTGTNRASARTFIRLKKS